MSIASVIDRDGVAVITGGASGFGFEVVTRCIKNGMSVAILDISKQELADAEKQLASMVTGSQRVLPVQCDVTKLEECQAAEKAVATAFQDRGISFLFNNAGISGKNGGMIMSGPVEDWKACFSVNVFGAVHIIKAFLPGMIQRGPLPSGKKSYVVTTSSVVGLLNHNLGPYSCSKMAATAVCEQLAIELEDMGTGAAHISPHSLHPTVCATNFLAGRDADGVKSNDGAIVPMLSKSGMTTPANVADGLFKGLEDGKHYVVVDHERDVPTSQQVAMRMQDQMDSARPRKPQQLYWLAKMLGAAQEQSKL